MAGCLAPSPLVGPRTVPLRRPILGASPASLLWPPSFSHRPQFSAGEVLPEQRKRLMVEARKRRSAAEKFGRQPTGPAPNLDTEDDAPKFVIFIKTKNVNIWYPLSVVSGGTTAKMMVNIMKWDLGKRLYGDTLTRNIGAVIYNDEKAIEQSALKQYPMLKGASGFEFGYKMVDPENPKASVSDSGVVKIPAKEDMKSVVDKVKDAFVGLPLPSFGTPAQGSTNDPKN